MSKTPDMVRIENGILWRSIWRELGQVPYRRKSERYRPLVRALNKTQIVQAAKRQGPMAHWLVEIALCEVMLRANKAIQTDLEDFVPAGESGTRRAALSI